MPTITGDGYLSNKINKAGTYYAFLVIDGQNVRKTTGKKDLDEAVGFLSEWKAQVKVGVVHGDTRLRYEAIRDNYLTSGKNIQESILRDLNEFFKDTYVSAITPTKIKQFRLRHESQARFIESKEKTVTKEFKLRNLKPKNKHTKNLSPKTI